MTNKIKIKKLEMGIKAQPINFENKQSPILIALANQLLLGYIQHYLQIYQRVKTCERSIDLTIREGYCYH